MIFRLVLNHKVYVHFLQRRGKNSPTLAFSASRTLRRRTQKTETRQKSLIWWTCRRLAKLEKSSRCTLSLTEETSSFNEVFASRRITSKPNCFFSSLCTLSTDEVSSVSDMYTWNVSLISQDSNMSTNTSDFLHAT